MNTEPERILNQLVVAAVTLFIVVVLLLAALVGRQMWLQESAAELSTDLQSNLDTLGETTQVIQDELLQLLETPEHAQNPEKWEEITEVLDDIDLQLNSLEEGIGEVAIAFEPVIEIPASTADVERQEEEEMITSDPIDQIFTFFAALVALASIAIAVLLGVSVRINQRA